MTARFTPGPWSVTTSGIYAESGWAVAYTPDQQGQTFTPEGTVNARLIAAAPDHALIGWAMCVQDATWEEWGDGKGEFCFAGLRHATTLDEFGCPVLTDNLRDFISKARGGE